MIGRHGSALKSTTRRHDPDDIVSLTRVFKGTSKHTAVRHEGWVIFYLIIAAGWIALWVAALNYLVNH